MDKLKEHRQVPERLGDATPAVRAALYRSMGFKVAYRRETNREMIKFTRLRARDLFRVGGATRPCGHASSWDEGRWSGQGVEGRFDLARQ